MTALALTFDAVAMDTPTVVTAAMNVNALNIVNNFLETFICFVFSLSFFLIFHFIRFHAIGQLKFQIQQELS